MTDAPGRLSAARVSLAHDLRHDRDVAIKVLHPETLRARLERELGRIGVPVE